MPPINNSSGVNVSQLFVPEIKELLAAREFLAIKAFLKDMSVVDLAEAWSAFTPDERTILFRLQSDRHAVALFQELEPEEQTELMQSLDDKKLQEIMGDLTPEDTARVFNELPEKTIRKLSTFVHKDKQTALEQMMTYPDQSVGALMHIQRIELGDSLMSSQALDRIRAAAQLRKGGGPDGYYVTDTIGRAVGWVPLRELIAAPGNMKLSEFMHTVGVLKLDPMADQEEAVRLFSRYKPAMAPVMDKNDKLLGYITSEDILPLVEEEATEDIQKLGGVEALDEPYFKTDFFKMVRKRGAWLFVLFLGEMLTATAMGFFEDEIAKAVVLALFIPLIISSGGNSGSQASTLIVRAMSLHEVTLRDWFRVMGRELASGFVLGAGLGLVGFLRVVVWSQFSNIYGPHYLGIGATVGITLLLIVMYGTLAGSLLPLLLKKVRLDPAVASAPFVATLVDVSGLVIYFVTALFFLKGTLL